MPKDPIMLLSYINTKLRDEYPSLKELCTAEDADMDEIINKLASVNYKYDEEKNRFI